MLDAGPVNCAAGAVGLREQPNSATARTKAVREGYRGIWVSMAANACAGFALRRAQFGSDSIAAQLLLETIDDSVHRRIIAVTGAGGIGREVFGTYRGDD
jgi:hypothetical protein